MMPWVMLAIVIALMLAGGDDKEGRESKTHDAQQAELIESCRIVLERAK